MAHKRETEQLGHLTSLVLTATEQLLDQMEEVIDHYRAVFFSGTEPHDIATRLGELATHFVKLADVGVALSTVEESTVDYAMLVSRLRTVVEVDQSSPPSLHIIRSDAADASDLEPF